MQFADVAMRVKCDVRRTTCHTLQEDVCDQALALVQFDRLMENRLVTPFYQPIVDIFSGRALGYEVLARSRVFGMESCAAMFNAAARLNMEVELSRMLRGKASAKDSTCRRKPTCLSTRIPSRFRGKAWSNPWLKCVS